MAVGRKRKEGVERYPGGQIVREKELTEKEKAANVSVVVEARQRVFGIDPKDARSKDAGSAVGRLLLGGVLATEKQAKDFAEAAEHFRLARQNYETAIDAKRLTTATDYTGTRQGRGSDESDPSYITWCNAARRNYAELRRAILEADPLAMTMLEMTVIEDKEPRNEITMGALRSGLNAVHRVLRNRRQGA